MLISQFILAVVGSDKKFDSEEHFEMVESRYRYFLKFFVNGRDEPVEQARLKMRTGEAETSQE